MTILFIPSLLAGDLRGFFFKLSIVFLLWTIMFIATLVDLKTGIDASKTSDTFYASIKAIYDWGVGLFVQKNTVITGATKTKITYDAKGLVTGGSDAFNGCTGFTGVTITKVTPPTLFTGVFSGTLPIYVPSESVATYKEATNWSAYAARIFAIV